MDSWFCSLTACLKNENNTKGQSAICEDRKNTEKYKNTNCFFGRNGKIPKKYKNAKCIFLYFICIFSFFVFLQKKYEKIEKNTKKYECNCSKIQNTKKTNQQFQKYKIQKKIRTQNFKNTIYKEKTNSKISQRANPVFTVEIRKQIAKKIQNQPLVFSKPCNSDFVFLMSVFRIFSIFKYGKKTLL